MNTRYYVKYTYISHYKNWGFEGCGHKFVRLIENPTVHPENHCGTVGNVVQGASARPPRRQGFDRTVLGGVIRVGK